LPGRQGFLSGSQQKSHCSARRVTFAATRLPWFSLPGSSLVEP